jgi:outer membrane receptor protein involved in Fe transport
MRFHFDSDNRLALWLGIAAAAMILMAGLPAVAQEEPAPAAEPTEEEAIEQAIQRSFEEEITVTGSLIPRPTLESMSPVSVMDPEEITFTGALRLEDVVRQMPQVFSQQNSTIANGASGTASIDLRNMGAERTLVLINGRRMVAGDAFEIAPDLNFIPAALVKRVDVLTGGASSVYGADAVTGVVNFVLDEDFEGMRGGIAWNGYQHDNNNDLAQEINADRGFDAPSGSTVDGDQWDVNLAFGHKFGEGRGHASLYFDYRNIEEALKSQRDYTNCAVGQGDEGPFCGGSSTIPLGRFQVFNRDWIRVGDYVLDETTGNTFRPRAGDVFNYAPYNHMQRPDEKISAGGFMNYEFNDYFELYGEVMFMDDYTEAQIAPSANFNNTTQINCDNPMLSPQQRDLICTQNGYGPDEYANMTIGRRSVESGPRTSILRHTSWRLLAGLRGDLSDAWSYDLYALYAEMSSPQEYIGDLSVTRMTNALDVVGDPDDPSTWACRNGGADGCVPWNLFSIGGVTPEAINYISLNMVMTTGTKTEMINGVLNGDLGEYGLKFPTATEGIQLALGADFRTESLYVHPDDNWENGNGSGQGGPTVRVDGTYDVAEYYLEGLVPIVQDAPMFKDLSLELGYRWSDYSTSGGVDTWKAQASWAPSDLLKLRVGIASASRAPNVQELFQPQGLGLGGSADPCAGANPAATLEQCLLTGMTAAQYGNSPDNPAQQYNTLNGGNPDLDPETADTFTAGIVLTPPSISGFSVAIDYWDIEITDTIDSFDADSVITGCIANGDPALCDLIHRDVAGTLWLFTNGYTITTEQNIGSVYGEGIDLNYAWLVGLGDAGFLNTSLTGTWMLADRLSNPLLDYDCVGFFGDQCAPYPTPEWRHRARISWETNFDMVFSLAWRYISSVMNDNTSSDPDLNSDSPGDEYMQINGVYEFDAFNYFDLAWTWSFADHYQFVLGINNILDEEPPLAAGMNDNDYGTGFYGFYDPYGRQLHAAMHFNF